MKERGKERLKQAIYENTQMAQYKSGDTRKQHASHESLMHADHADGSDDERHPEKLKGSEVLPEDGKGEKNG